MADPIISGSKGEASLPYLDLGENEQISLWPLFARKEIFFLAHLSLSVDFWGSWLNVGEDGSPRPWVIQLQVEIFTFYFLWKWSSPETHLCKLSCEWCLSDLYTWEVKGVWMVPLYLGWGSRGASHLSLIVLQMPPLQKKKSLLIYYSGFCSLYDLLALGIFLSVLHACDAFKKLI